MLKEALGDGHANAVVAFFAVIAVAWVCLAVMEKVLSVIALFQDEKTTAGVAGGGGDFLYAFGAVMIIAVFVGFAVNRKTQRKEMSEIRAQLAEIQRTQERMVKILFPEGEAADGKVHTDN